VACELLTSIVIVDDQLVATVAARLADFESARSVLGESARFQYDV
jgi:ATP-dependent Lhr-like helicase